ncbi:MAG: hypothetical protein ACRDL6_01570 [Solirubrobacterales bacterium]
MGGAGRGATERLDVARVVADVLRVYRRHWRLLVPIAVVVLLPQTLAEVTIGPLEVERVDGFADVAKLALLPISAVVSLLGEAFYAGVVAAAVLEWRAGRRLPRAGALARAIPYRRLVASDLLLVLGAAIGLALLIVPGVVFLTYFFIAPAVIKLEGRGVRDAFRRSAELVRGSFWRVFAIGLVAVLGTELASEGLGYLMHTIVADVVAEMAVDAVLEPWQGLVTVLVALALIELRGEGDPTGPATWKPTS